MTSAEPKTNGLASARLWPVVAVALGLALATRLPHFVNLAVPLGDGGMFAQIVDDLRANGLRLPNRTHYNELSLPLSYPPLGFYVTAIVGMLTGLPTLEVQKWMPLLFNLGAVVAFVHLAKRMLEDRRAVWVASILFALLPSTAAWLMMGGGMTRSPGFFFSILAMVAGYDALKKGRARDIARTGLFAGLAGLSHLESGTLVCLTLFLFGLRFSPPQLSVRRLLPAAGLAVAVALPWFLWLVANVGFEPLRNASKTGGAPLLWSVGNIAQGKILVDFPGLGVGLIVWSAILLRRRDWFFPAWLAIVVLFVSRSAYTQSTIPGCLMVGQAWVALTGWLGERRWPALLRPAFSVGLWSVVAVGFTAARAINLYVFDFPFRASRSDNLGRVSAAQRAAMEWCRANTPEDARFFVLSERMEHWYHDVTGEWLPYLAQRKAVMTVQGREWRPNREFDRWSKALARAANTERRADLHAMMDEVGIRYDHVFVSGPLEPAQKALAHEIACDPTYRLVYDRGGVQVYRASRMLP